MIAMLKEMILNHPEGKDMIHGSNMDKLTLKGENETDLRVVEARPGRGEVSLFLL